MGRRLGLRTFQTEGTPCSEAGMWTKQGKTDHRKKVHVAGAMESLGRGMLWWRGLAIPFQEVSLVHSLGARGGMGGVHQG